MKQVRTEAQPSYLGRQSNFPLGASVYKSAYFNLFPGAYNPYHSPATLRFAEDHAAATKFGRTIGVEEGGIQRYCQCCRNLIDSEQFDWRAGITAIGMETPEYAMLFYFFAFGFFWLLWLFLLVGIGSLVEVKAIRGTFLSAAESLGSSGEEVTKDFARSSTARGVTGLLAVLSFSLLRRLFQRFLRHQNDKFEASRLTPGVFSLRIKTPDLAFKSPEQLIKDLKTISDYPDLSVVNLNYVYDIRRYSRILLSLMRLQKEFRKKFVQFGENFPERAALEKTNTELLQNFRNVRNTFASPAGIASAFTGFVFVTFSTPRQRALVERRFEKSWGFKTPELEGYRCKSAAEPKNVFWENYGCSKTSKIVRRLTTHLVTTLILVLSLAIILGIKVGQYSSSSSEEPSFGRSSINFLISIIIAGFNISILALLRYITGFEKRKTFSSDQSNQIVKISIAMFLNSAIVILISSLLASLIQGSSSKDSISLWRLWSNTGTITSIASIMLTSLGIHFINPFLYMNWITLQIKRYLLTYHVKRNTLGNKVLQSDLNESYAHVQFDLVDAYSCFFKNLSIAMFYSIAFPFGLLLTMGMMVVHFIASYLEIIYLRGKVQNFDFDFTEKMANFLPFCSLMFAVGFIVLESIAGQGVPGFAWATFAIAVFDAIANTVFFFAKPGKTELEISDIQYEKYQYSFPENYDRLNPITQVSAFAKWVHGMKSRNNQVPRQNVTQSQLSELIRPSNDSQAFFPQKFGPQRAKAISTLRSIYNSNPSSFNQSFNDKPLHNSNEPDQPNLPCLDQKEPIPSDIMTSMINYTLFRQRTNHGYVKVEYEAPTVPEDYPQHIHFDSQMGLIDIYRAQKLIGRDIEFNSKVSKFFEPGKSFHSDPMPFKNAIFSIFDKNEPQQTPTEDKHDFKLLSSHPPGHATLFEFSSKDFDTFQRQQVTDLNVVEPQKLSEFYTFQIPKLSEDPQKKPETINTDTLTKDKSLEIRYKSKWLREMLENQKIQQISSCHQPKNLEDTDIHSLDLKDIEADQTSPYPLSEQNFNSHLPPFQNNFLSLLINTNQQSSNISNKTETLTHQIPYNLHNNLKPQIQSFEKELFEEPGISFSNTAVRQSTNPFQKKKANYCSAFEEPEIHEDPVLTQNKISKNDFPYFFK